MQKANSLNMLRSSKRRPFKVSSRDLVRTEPLYSDASLPLVFLPAGDGVDLISWAGDNTELIADRLLKHGSLLFRGFNLNGAEDFEKFLGAAFKQELLSYYYRSTPRTHITGKIYSSTEYPSDTVIPLHNESAYARTWPMKVVFYCDRPASRGGETPIADSRRIFQKIDPEIRERFQRQGILYIRNYAKRDVDLSWQEAFQTEDPAEVEAYCRGEEIDFEWIGDRLRTRQICRATAQHPETGEWVWFNQAHLFHVSGLKDEVRQALLEDRAQDDLPRNSYYADGSTIEDSVMARIREVMAEEKVVFPWHRGDILVMENMLAAHGRNAFQGERRVLVGMIQAMHARDLSVAQ